MSKLNIEAKAGIRNFAHVTVRNVKTGEIISTQRVKNVVLQQYINKALGLTGFGAMSSILFGTGSGVPSKEDTGLFNPVLTVGTSQISYTRSEDYLTTTKVVQGTMISSQNNGQVIKEIGLGGGGNLALTKIQLQSPIEKTDMIEIQVQYSITLQLVNYNDKLTWVYTRDGSSYLRTDDYNLLVAALLESFSYSGGVSQCFGKDGNAYPTSTLTPSGVFAFAGYGSAIQIQVEDGSATYSSNVTTQKLNGCKIREMAFSSSSNAYSPSCPMYRLALPCPGVFEYFQIEDANQLTSGAQTFLLKWEGYVWDDVIEDSEEIKVNGEIKTRGTDYNFFPDTAQVEWIGTPPGGTITATWKVPYIPKTSLMMLSPTLTISLAEIQ